MYNYGQTGIDDVRIETGNLLPADYPDTQITKKLNSAFSKVQLAVGRPLSEPFDALDVEAEYAHELELKIAAKDALKAYGSEFLEKVKELDDEIKEDIAFLQDNIQETGTGEEGDIVMTASDYVSYGAMLEEDPTNPNLRMYRSGLTDSV